MDFTQHELRLLYAACMNYGSKLSDMARNIPNEAEFANAMFNKAEESWKLAAKITKYMKEDD